MALICLTILVLCCFVGPSQARDKPEQQQRSEHLVAQDSASLPKVQELSNRRYRVGLIEIDQARQHFTVPGTILRVAPPLEFLAVSKGGYKAYESLLEVDASAHEFNLACVLVGLDPDKGKGARLHFDPKPIEGDAVKIRVEWKLGGRIIRADAADLISLGEKTLSRGQWVYTGSAFAPDGRYLADLDGTVVGFVHDPSSIIEHRTGLIGQYGVVAPNSTLVPAVGTRITLSVALVANK